VRSIVPYSKCSFQRWMAAPRRRRCVFSDCAREIRVGDHEVTVICAGARVVGSAPLMRYPLRRKRR
jgi:hypothetical protein